MRVQGKTVFKYRPKLRRRRSRKVARALGVRIDEPVGCPSCGNLMRLSELCTFKCQQCAQELTTDEALVILEMAGA